MDGLRYSISWMKVKNRIFEKFESINQTFPFSFWKFVKSSYHCAPTASLSAGVAFVYRRLLLPPAPAPPPRFRRPKRRRLPLPGAFTFSTTDSLTSSPGRSGERSISRFVLISSPVSIRASGSSLWSMSGPSDWRPPSPLHSRRVRAGPEGPGSCQPAMDATRYLISEVTRHVYCRITKCLFCLLHY